MNMLSPLNIHPKVVTWDTHNEKKGLYSPRLDFHVDIKNYCSIIFSLQWLFLSIFSSVSRQKITKNEQNER